MDLGVVSPQFEGIPRRGFAHDVEFVEDGAPVTLTWFAQTRFAEIPVQAQFADDSTTADAALRVLRSGSALIWRGDFQNGRQLLSSLSRRILRKRRVPSRNPAEAFRRHRAERATLADLLGRVLIPLSEDYVIHLRRAPDVRVACAEAYGPASADSLVSLREIQGIVGAHEWREKGVPVAALGASIHPHYGVFSPIRGEYLDLVATAPLPDGAAVAFDIGTGTGVLAAILAARGIASVVATDQDDRAVECARENLLRLGFENSVEVQRTDLFPDGRADIIVCNPPWIPATPASSLDYAVYDKDSAMLRRFLTLAGEHLAADGEVWLVISNLAELLNLRGPAELSDIISASELDVIGQLQTLPTHARVNDATDPLHAARSAEITSLWRLVRRSALTPGEV